MAITKTSLCLSFERAVAVWKKGSQAFQSTKLGKLQCKSSGLFTFYQGDKSEHVVFNLRIVLTLRKIGSCTLIASLCYRDVFKTLTPGTLLANLLELPK